jgi:hypothetical protein
MNKVTKVYTCTLCEEYDDVCGHNLPQTGYRCNLCLFIHSRNREAESCCMDMTDKSVVDESCLAKERKARPKDFDIVPVASLQGRRDR